MTGQEYRALIAHLQLNQVEAARVLGVDPRTSRKWALDETPVPVTVTRFLRYLVATMNTPAFKQFIKRKEA
jgi:hypothetical protein